MHVKCNSMHVKYICEMYNHKGGGIKTKPTFNWKNPLRLSQSVYLCRNPLCRNTLGIFVWVSPQASPSGIPTQTYLMKYSLADSPSASFCLFIEDVQAILRKTFYFFYTCFGDLVKLDVQNWKPQTVGIVSAVV